MFVYNSSQLLKERGSADHFETTNGFYDDTLASMYSAEYFLVEWIKRSGFVVTDPEEANLFLVPQYGVLITEMCRRQGFGLFDCSSNVTKRYISVLIDAVSSKEWYKRNDGADHMWIFTWDHGCDLYPGMCGRIENCIHIIQEPTNLHRPLMKRPLVIPAPVQSTWNWKRTQEIALLRDCERSRLTGPTCRVLKRPNLIFFAGTVHADRGYSRGVRQDLKKIFEEKQRSDVVFLDHAVPDYEEQAASSTFCLCPPGWAPWSPRLYAAMAASCIPVMYPMENYFMALPFNKTIPWNSLMVMIPPGQISRTYEILSEVSEQKRLEMRIAAAQYVPMILIAQYPERSTSLVLKEALQWSKVKVSQKRLAE